MTAGAVLPTLVFLDRDGTIIRDEHYLSNPDRVELLEGAADAITRLNRSKIPVVLITNQSGIARGYFTVANYEQVHARMLHLLAEHDASLDASYYCPHYPDISGVCTCRKPSPLLFLQAIQEHHFDASRPVFIGDRWRDLAPMESLGGRGILIISPETPPEDAARASNEASSCISTAPSLAAAVDTLLGVSVP